MSYKVTTPRQHKPRSGVALGGIGCGWFELRQDGTFHNWNLFNNQPSALGPPFPYPAHSVLFFLLRVEEQGREPFLRLLQIEESHGAAGIEVHEFQYVFPWMSGMDLVEFEGSVPFCRLQFREKSTPLAIKLTAWSPFIPHDVKNSSLPAAFFELSVRSTTNLPVKVTLLASLRNCVGYDRREKNVVRTAGPRTRLARHGDVLRRHRPKSSLLRHHVPKFAASRFDLLDGLGASPHLLRAAFARGIGR